MNELKSCPFCNNVPILFLCEEDRNKIFCITCAIEMDHKFWNTRASLWISVEDRLPNDLQEVLVWAHGHVSDYIDISIYVNNEFILSNVTHWQPLPKPPKA